jgi:hypothetical protein
MQFNVNQQVVKMLELINTSPSLIWKLTIPILLVVLAWKAPEIIIALSLLS